MRVEIVAFASGVAGGLLLPSIPPVAGFGFIVALLALLRWLPFAARVFTCAMLGVLWFSYHAGGILAQALPTGVQGEMVVIRGHITQLPHYANSRWQFNFQATHLIHEDYHGRYQGKLKLSWKPLASATHAQQLQPGQQWQFKVRLYPRRSTLNPGVFDYSRWLFQQRIQATGFVLHNSDAQLLVLAPRWHLDTWRLQLVKRLSTLLTDKPMSALLIALALGDRHAITDAQWQMLQQTGTAHLMAISGLHIGLVAVLSFWGIYWLWGSTRGALWVPAPYIAAAISLVMAVLYAALAGFAIPTQRALIMVLVVVISILLKREIPLSYQLLWALLLVLLWDPLAVMSIGFWLSFAAVGILLFALSGKKAFHLPELQLVRVLRLSGLVKWLFQFSRAQWAIILGLMPLSIYTFGYIAINAFLANLVAIPVVSFFVVPCTLLALICLDWLPSLAVGLLLVADGVLQGVWGWLNLLQQLPWTIWQRAHPALWVLIAAWVGVLLLLLPRGFAGRWLGLIWLSPLLLTPVATPRSGEIWITVLDVGQGLAVVVRTQQHTLLYDTGMLTHSGFDLGSRVVVPYLKAQGIHQLDTLLISHDDIDHSGGAPAVLDALAVKQIVTSAPQAFSAYPNVQSCILGQTWQWDMVNFRLLHPPQPYFAADNDRSCVLQIHSGHSRVLLTGDITRRAETRLVEVFGSQLAAEVLLVPHHGSRSSSSPEFLDKVQPQIAVVSSGYNNRYRLPHSQVLTRYQQRQIALYNTADSGAVELRLSTTGIERIRLTREWQQRFWH